MRRIQSKSHKIGTCGVNNDNKRYILDDGVHTLADFHKDFKKQVFRRKENTFKEPHRKEKVFTDSHQFSQMRISANK